MIAIVGCEKEVKIESDNIVSTAEGSQSRIGSNQSTFELIDYEVIDDIPSTLTVDMKNVKTLFRYSEISLIDFYSGTWLVDGTNMSCRMAVLKSNNVEANTYLLYDEFNQNPPIIVDVQMNRFGEVKLCRYFNSEGVLLACASGITPDNYAFTYVNDTHEGSPAEMGFIDCINTTLNNPTVMAVSLAAAMTGGSGAVAAGILIGCGIHSLL